MFDKLTVNQFRKARGKLLAQQIADLSSQLGRKISILDVGGRSEYWGNVGLSNISSIRLLNNDESELSPANAGSVFTAEYGDACNLANFESGSVDLVHSNSVIEHVGDWPHMCAMADEARRVGRSGWIQTPAWEFPIEPHFKLPFLHWFAQPMRRSLLRLSSDYGKLSVKERRHHIDRINLLSYSEFQSLFPDCTIFIERLVLAKSYVARWLPASATRLD